MKTKNIFSSWDEPLSPRASHIFHIFKSQEKVQFPTYWLSSTTEATFLLGLETSSLTSGSSHSWSLQRTFDTISSTQNPNASTRSSRKECEVSSSSMICLICFNTLSPRLCQYYQGYNMNALLGFTLIRASHCMHKNLKCVRLKIIHYHVVDLHSSHNFLIYSLLLHFVNLTLVLNILQSDICEPIINWSIRNSRSF
jgi:hypothetical protein